MSANCIPKKADRIAVVERTITKLASALHILRKVKDPDKDKHSLELVSSQISKALGDFYDDGGDPEDQEAPKEPGLRRLLEHYFS